MKAPPYAGLFVFAPSYKAQGSAPNIEWHWAGMRKDRALIHPGIRRELAIHAANAIQGTYLHWAFAATLLTAPSLWHDSRSTGFTASY